jgi:hypothetical protein
MQKCIHLLSTMFKALQDQYLATKLDAIMAQPAVTLHFVALLTSVPRPVLLLSDPQPHQASNDGLWNPDT